MGRGVFECRQGWGCLNVSEGVGVVGVGRGRNEDVGL